MLSSLGRFQEALAGFEAAQSILMDFGDEVDVARCTMGSANSCRGLGRSREALAGYEDAEAVSVRFGQTTEAAAAR